MIVPAVAYFVVMAGLAAEDDVVMNAVVVPHFVVMSVAVAAYDPEIVALNLPGIVYFVAKEAPGFAHFVASVVVAAAAVAAVVVAALDVEHVVATDDAAFVVDYYV